MKSYQNNLNGIIKECINSVLKDYSKVRNNANFDNPISRYMKLPLHEGLIKTYPLDKTIEYIKNHFNLSSDEIYPINAENGMEQIAIQVPIIGNNLELVKKAFELCGYYLGYPKEDMLKQNTIYELQFEKKYDNDFSEKLRSHESVLYHITPQYYGEKIRRIGLAPRSKNASFDYPSRTYFIIGSAKKIIPYVASELYNSLENKMNNGKYCIITFDLNKIPSKVKFYLDPNSKYSVYTYDNISPNAIININEIEV